MLGGGRFSINSGFLGVHSRDVWTGSDGGGKFASSAGPGRV